MDPICGTRRDHLELSKLSNGKVTAGVVYTSERRQGSSNVCPVGNHHGRSAPNFVCHPHKTGAKANLQLLIVFSSRDASLVPTLAPVR